MPRPSQRSQERIKRVRTPGGRLVIHYLNKRKQGPKCALCKRKLPGFSISKKKDHKPPNRIYGGYLCSTCLRQVFKKTLHALFS
ncbi:MAG TPA: 50S ribosomal protein L34e [Candidatus Desulfofervidus auxilii]|uniref:50S ribosomal protein L34e n=1 Tax=Desulfofervidus auxilii TaxID=1621989 RepID=A0A7C0U1W7_DESA2|nr:MAG: 50S ribosomal protein L34e [Thermoprotei archaeon]RLE72352.1 MAG: 50S ribosomal protein L34e [Thermoprotei archaeon]HDD43754.1 50S ribosomal protein L34e [Candidatus Desulfofervidus auxilii]